MDTDRYIKIRKELDDIKGMIENVNNQMQELQQSIRGTSFSAPMLSVPQPYEHPWWQYQRPGSYPCRNNLGGEVQASSVNLDETRSRISREEEAA
ncbi:hypothetical protein S-PM2d161 [Synechococcus phage S-PM2]|uniref:Hypothetical-Protein / belonging to T4-LIKE GC: 858 n=1 Tax=Synechococcus phage S-PM2 TaxID=238854 RepID=Q5GQH6_BPSYP|nr:Hypothetical-Protein / belonging to T4-LIKE GC: 858 [Synechococcus phage S-PM2]CAF34226.1 Hypothetical-Protein / belonging to T4-LIKE GC: 858 [Synechococcus phage S-PM2]CFW42361.1 hypothetical protein S-PM2d161 [Synechococcus phage S-PM2]